MASRLPWLVRLFCNASRHLLPRDLWLELGRDINEAYYDLHVEAVDTGRAFATTRLLTREVTCLLRTARAERAAARRDREALLAIHARPRLGRPASDSHSPGPNPLVVVTNMLDSFLADIRFAFRTLRKTPVFTAVAIATLALGIGANAAVFSVINTVLLKPLPYERPEELVVVWTNFGRDLPENWLSGPEFLEIRDLNTTLDDFAVMTTSGWSMTGDGTEPQQVMGLATSGGFFDLLGTPPARGRLYTVADDDDAQRVVVVSDGFWRTQLAAAADVLGRSLILDGVEFQIIGVLPPDFRVHHPNVSNPDSMAIYAPFQAASAQRYEDMSRGSHFLLGLGRMTSGTTVAQAQSDMDAVAARMAETTGEYDFEGWGLTTYSLHADLVEDVQGALVILLGAVGFVLLIACLNVANLQLSRAADRGREIALRTALGAGRARLVRQLLTESLVLASIGAAAGLGLALWLIRGLLLGAPAGLPRADGIALDATVLAFTALATLLTVLLFGVVPGLLATRTNLADTLKDSGRTSSAGTSGKRMRSTLVVVEVALALVLLVGAGLLIRSFSGLLRNNPGYNPDGLLTVRVALPQPKYDADTALAFHQQFLDRVHSLPNVTQVGAIDSLPLSGFGGSGTTLAESSDAEGVDRFGGFSYIEADRRYVSAGYFETMQTELVEGRYFTGADIAGELLVAIVDESFARRFWGDASPLGQRIAVSFQFDREAGELGVIEWREIVGVVRHERTRNLRTEGREQAYVPMQQSPRFGMHVAIRTDADPAALTASVRQAVWDIDPQQPVSDIATMSSRVSESVATPRFNSILLGSFAAAALLLSALGIYGVVSFSVGQRTGEIGVRMALGASQAKVRAMVLREGMLVVVLGLLLGLGAAVGLTRAITSMLYGVTATDPTTYGLVAGLLVAVAASACLLPAARATRVEPVAALRED